MVEAAEFLMAMAEQLERWAKGSVGGGWSTHQVDDQRRKATDCRAQAAKLYRQAAQL